VVSRAVVDNVSSKALVFLRCPPSSVPRSRNVKSAPFITWTNNQSAGILTFVDARPAQITRTFGWIQRLFNFGSPFWTSTDTTANTFSQTKCVVLIATIVYIYNPWTKFGFLQNTNTEQKPSKTKNYPHFLTKEQRNGK
jgi:hypothetical protein